MPGSTSAGGVEGPSDHLDAQSLRTWLHLARRVSESSRELVDSLNVFPVPDSDTGTNVMLTLDAACDALALAPAGADLLQTARTAADGAVRGARGNSGLLVSQALSALADVCAEAPDPSRLRPVEMVHAYEQMASSTWQAVSRPVEGTLLTVAKDAAAAARSALDDASASAPATVRAVAASAALGAQESVVETSGLGHGPVDAGGAALMLLLTCLSDTLDGTVSQDNELPPYTSVASQMLHDLSRTGGDDGGDHGEVSTGEFEVMYLLEATAAQAAQLREDLEDVGDSVGVVGTPDALGVGLYQVHVHTNTPRAALPRTGRARQVCVHYLYPTALALRSPWDSDEPPLPAQASGGGHVISFERLAARRNERQAAQRRESRRHHPSSGGSVTPRPGRSTGVVACTRAPGLIEPLARTGAVVVLDPDRDGIVRATGDRGIHQVLVLPCDAASANHAHEAARHLAARSAASFSRPVEVSGSFAAEGETVQLLVCDTDDETRVLAAAVAVAGAVGDEGLSALALRAARAAAALRTTSLDGPKAEPEAVCATLAMLLRPEDELVTLVLGQRAEPDVGALAREVVSRYAESVHADPDAVELVVHAGDQPHPDVLLAVE